jgi:hypothetical protein
MIPWKWNGSTMTARSLIFHQVMLVGWPVRRFDPHVLSIKEPDECVAALKGPDPTCYWKKITEEELKEHHEAIAQKMALGEIVPKTRKTRSDIGKKRGPKGKKRVRDDSDKENDSEGPRVTFCSASIISSNE